MKHHVKEEENELFPKVRSSGLDLDALGRQLAGRKQQLAGGTSGGRRTGNGKRRPAKEARAG